MNIDLVKNIRKPTDARKRAMIKYMKNHRTICVTLHKDDDADIIEWLLLQENRSAYIRDVLRTEAKKHVKHS